MSSGTSINRRNKVVGALMPVCLLAMALSATSVRAAVLTYEFGVNPTAEPVPMTGYYQSVTPESGGTGYGAGAGLLGNGTAEFADSPSQNADSGFVIGNPTWTGDYTVDVRVKVIDDVTDGAGKSMSVTTDSQGRGIKLNKANITLVNGTGIAPGGGPFAVDLASDFKILRFSVQIGATNTVTAYVWDGTSAWIGLGATSLGGSGAGGEVPHPGVGIGSLAGGSTTSGKFIIDYARIDTAAARGNTIPPLPGPSATCLQTVLPAGTQSLTAYPGGAAYPFASVDLGATDASDGIAVSFDVGPGSDGNVEPAVIGGRECHKNTSPASTNNFMYFTVDDARAFNGSIPSVTFSFDYFDIGTETLSLQYDGAGNPYTGIPIVTLTNTNTWKTATVSVTDAKFSNSENGASDFRVGGDGVATFYLDTVTLTATGSHGPRANYTYSNAGTTPFDWTVTEVNCDGSAHDYNWLTVSPASGTGLAASSSVPILATINTTPLSPGPQTGYLKFTRSCASAGCFSDPFTNPGGGACTDPGDPPNGKLPETNFYNEPCLFGQNGWTSNTIHYSAISITNGSELRLNGGGDSSVSQVVTHAATCTGSVISVKADVRLGGAANPEANFWQLRAYDNGGNNLGLWQGTQFHVAAKELNGTNSTPAGALTAGYITLEMRINTGCRTTDYYFNNALVISYPWAAAASGSLAKVDFVAINGRASSATDYIFVDNLSVTGMSDDIRRIDLNVLGCSIVVMEPRIRSIGQCADTSLTTEEFTIKNNGAFPWTGFTAAQFGTARPWLTGVTFTSGPVPVGGSALVTANINWSQVTVSEGARIRFSATCDGSNFVNDTPSVGGGIETINVAAPNSPARFKIVYTGGFNKMPTDTSSAGVGYKFEIAAGAEQGSVVDDPSDTNPSDHKYYQLVDLAGQSTLMRLITDGGGHVPITGTTGATVVARLKTESFTQGSSIPQNLLIFHDTIAAGINWKGNGGMAESFRGNQVSVINDSAYHIVRITSVDVPGIGVIEKVYIDENPAPVLTLQPAGNANAGLGSSPTVAGVGFGTSSGSAVQTIWYDWVSGTNAGAFAPGEEDDCIGSLFPVDLCDHTGFAWSDLNKDGSVDANDFGLFQRCYSGDLDPIPSVPGVNCACLDRDAIPDGHVSTSDLNAFYKCVPDAQGIGRDANGFTPSPSTGVPWSLPPGCDNH